MGGVLRAGGVALAWVLVAGDARAQVNTEALRPAKLESGWGGDAEGNMALSRGNIRLLDLGGSGRVLYQTLHNPGSLVPYIEHRVFLAANGRLAERAGATFINQGFTHLRWTWMPHERVGPEVFSQYQFNEFLRLQIRALAGGGLRVDLVHREHLMIWGASGYMIEYNKIRVEPGAPDAPETLEHRSTSYLTVRLELLEGKLRLQNTLYVQPRIDLLSDLRLLDDLEFSGKITDRFSLGSSFSLLHDSAPPTGVVPTDLRLTSNVRFSF